MWYAFIHSFMMLCLLSLTPLSPSPSLPPSLSLSLSLPPSYCRYESIIRSFKWSKVFCTWRYPEVTDRARERSPAEVAAEEAGGCVTEHHVL